MIQLPTPITELHNSIFLKKNIRLWIKRDDLTHPEIQGNKYRKLHLNIEQAKKENKKHFVTFGGAYSNHIYATAAAGKYFGIKTIGIIRGEKIEPLNPTLSFAQNCGMQLHFVNRNDYRLKEEILHQFDFIKEDCYIVPEGGTNQLAIKGCQVITEEILNQMSKTPDYIALSCGTGGTISGVISNTPDTIQVLGFSALKGSFLTKEIQNLLTTFSFSHKKNWTLQSDYHFGGYAKFDNNLINFINTFKENFQIQLDPIYTGKMMYGIFDLIQKDFFKSGSRIVAIHTGGLQGIAGFNERFDFPLK